MFVVFVIGHLLWMCKSRHCPCSLYRLTESAQNKLLLVPRIVRIIDYSSAIAVVFSSSVWNFLLTKQHGLTLSFCFHSQHRRLCLAEENWLTPWAACPCSARKKSLRNISSSLPSMKPFPTANKKTWIFIIYFGHAVYQSQVPSPCHHRRKCYTTINQSIHQSIHQSINQSINRRINQSINRSINLSVPRNLKYSQSINPSVNQSINQSNNRSINQSINLSVPWNLKYSQSINQSIDQLPFQNEFPLRFWNFSGFL